MKLVAEVANTHDGSFGNAIAFIDAIAMATACLGMGVSAVKFQYHLPDLESSTDENWRTGAENYSGETRIEYWRRVSFNQEQIHELAARARYRGLQFGCSVFCSAAVGDIVEDCHFLKIPSGEWDNDSLADAIANRGIETYQSLGMCPGGFQPRPGFIPVNCATAYPAAADMITIDCGRGLSNHSPTIWPGIIAAWLKCPYYETHVCWSRDMFGPDVSSSITIAELKTLAEGIQFIFEMGSAPIAFAQRLDRHLEYRKGRDPK